MAETLWWLQGVEIKCASNIECKFVCLINKRKKSNTLGTEHNLLVPGPHSTQTCYPSEELYRQLCSSVYATQGKLQGTCLDFLLLGEDIKCHKRHTLHQKLNFLFCLRVLRFLIDAHSLFITFRLLCSTSVLPPQSPLQYSLAGISSVDPKCQAIEHQSSERS